MSMLKVPVPISPFSVLRLCLQAGGAQPELSHTPLENLLEHRCVIFIIFFVIWGLPSLQSARATKTSRTPSVSKGAKVTFEICGPVLALPCSESFFQSGGKRMRVAAGFFHLAAAGAKGG